jgi:hypothetical protein
MQTKRLMASGKTASSISGRVSIVKGETTLQIMADLALLILEKGRGPTKKGSGSGPTLKAQIRTWLDYKNIVPFDPKITKDQLAFLIARKIHREGIVVPNKHNPGGVISDVINDKLIDQIFEEIKAVVKDQIITVAHSAVNVSQTVLT